MKVAILIVGILILITQILIGVGILIGLEDLQTTLRLTDLACPIEGNYQ